MVSDISLRALQERLFTQIDNLANARGETGLDEEVLRTKSVCAVAEAIISAGRVGLDAYELAAKVGVKMDLAPDVLAAAPSHKRLPAKND